MEKNLRKKIEGFTLIELLIVVAIIAILAAIAVPNFIEAQTRAKVSRTKTDMRTLGIALEAYAVDNNSYIFPGASYNTTPWSEFGDSPGCWWLYIDWAAPNGLTGPSGSPNPQGCGYPLTSPVAYLASIPTDIFCTALAASQAPIWGEAGVYNASVLYSMQLNGPTDFAGELGGCAEFASLYKDVGYWMVSVGPCLDLIYYPIYDPSNGTVSEGNIVYLGKGIGYIN